MKILANDGISPSGIAPLEAAGFEVQTTKVAQEQLIDYIKQRASAYFLSAAPPKRERIDRRLPGSKMIGRGGVGMDNIDVEYAQSKGVEVINTPAASSDSVAELVFSHLFGMLRFLYTSNREMPLERQPVQGTQESLQQGKRIARQDTGHHWIRTHWTSGRKKGIWIGNEGVSCRCQLF